MKAKRLFALALAVFLCVCLAAPIFADGTTYYVGSAEELNELSAKCAVDTYSQGITVSLTADIDLTDFDFNPIPTFGGVFDGGGHTVSGLEITKNGSHVGLFRYIQPSGTVKNLTVRGIVAPGGSGEYVGGIAGCNLGTIESCTFSGSVEGRIDVGGIAGTNELGAVIKNCSSYGYVLGEHYTGGITGQNLGETAACKNAAAVNTTSEEAELNFAEFDFEKLNSTENINDYTDTGGIAGFSSGTISDCRNSGLIGYEHMGYNVGGIAGRQSGYVEGCENTGSVRGRKEVGGIVGQMEPYLTVDLSGSTAENLALQLQRLHDLLDTTLVHAQGSVDSISTSFEAVTTYMSGASDDLGYIADRTVQTIDSAVGAINDVFERADYIADSMPAILNTLSTAGASLNEALRYLQLVNEDLALVDKMETGQYDETDHALFTVTTGTGGTVTADAANPAAGQTVNLTVTPAAGYELLSIVATDADGAELPITDNGGGSLSFVMPTLSGDPVNDPVNAKAKSTVVRAAFTPTANYFSETGNTVCIETTSGGHITASSLTPAAGETVTLTVTPGEGYALTALSVQDSSQNAISVMRLNDLGTSYSFAMPAESTASISARFSRMSDWQTAQEAAETVDVKAAELSAAMDDLNAAVVRVNAALNQPNMNSAELASAASELVTALGASGSAASALIDAASTLMSVTSPYVSEAATQLNAHLDLAIQNLRAASNSLTDAGAQLRAVFNHINGLPDITVEGLGSEYNERVDSLCDNLKNMSEALADLNEALSDAGTVLVTDLRAVNDQFNVVMLLLVDAISGISSINIDDMFTDISDDGAPTTLGSVAESRNLGSVYGDINVGGISGAMAVEYDFDPESDVTGASSTARAYISRCVVRSCENRGAITAKKDGAGGIVGYMDLGMATDCRGFGFVTSEDGDYVGGIAGQSMTVIRDCWAMCELSGDDYIGGIAGSAARVYESRALVEIAAGDECLGAIAGALEEESEALENTFTSDTLHGIDGISYTGRAERVSYERLSSGDAPEDIKNLAISYSADGIIVKTIPFEYGGSIDEAEIPAVPEKDGYNGSWPELDYSRLTFSRTLEAEYVALNSALASTAVRGESSRPIILVEGGFRDGASVYLTQSEDSPSVTAEETVLESIDVSVTGSALDSSRHTVRYLAPETDRPTSATVIYVRQNGDWEKVWYSTRGSYLSFEVESDDFTIACVESPSNTLLIVCIALGVLIFAAMVHLRIKSRKRKRKPAHLAK